MISEKKILIIDDDERNIFALSAVLRTKGYTLVSAPSAITGIELMLAHKDTIGIVLMDMMMPDVDGYEALKRIRSMEEIREIPVIAVTAQAMIGDREKCLQAGADEYIPKPVDVDELVNAINLHTNQ